MSYTLHDDVWSPKNLLVNNLDSAIFIFVILYLVNWLYLVLIR